MTEWTEDLIERRVEIMVDHLDAVFMAGKMTESDYDAAMKSLRQWEDARYHEMEIAKRVRLMRLA